MSHFFLNVYFKAGCLCVALAVVELALSTRLASNPASLYLRSAGIKAVHQWRQLYANSLQVPDISK